MRFIIIILSCFIMTHGINASDFRIISNHGYNAESSGIGNVVGFSSDYNELFGNPASLYRLPSSGASYFYNEIFSGMGLRYNALAMGKKNSRSMISIGIYESKMRNISKTDINEFNEAIEVSQFDCQNMIGKIGIQYYLNKKFSFGASATYYRISFDDIKGHGGNIDIGFASVEKENSKLAVSAVVQNIVPSMFVYYNNQTKEELTTQGKLAIKLMPLSFLHMFGQASIQTSKSKAIYSLASRLFLFKKILYVSGGVRQHYKLNNVEHSIVFGTGLDLKYFKIDYALEPYDFGENGRKNYFSMKLNI